MGESIPCPAGCGGLVYDGGYLDAGDLIEMCGCQDDGFEGGED